MAKCQKCPKAATLHITEVSNYEIEEELHLCEECAQKLQHTPATASLPKALLSPDAEAEDPGQGGQQVCATCGIKFVEFRNSGRLGCPHDYEAFRTELVPLLENIHGETRHRGKVPRRLPQSKQVQSELMQLRTKLNQAVSREAYEEAARIRDRIRQIEET